MSSPPPTPDPQHATVLFADVSDSSGLFRRLGDEGANRVLDQVLGLLGREVEQVGGEVVERIGDEILALFPDPRRALAAAVAQQERVQDLSRTGAEPLAVRIGFHHGPIGRQGRRVTGATVYRAKRIADSAKAEQVLTSHETYERLDDGSFRWRLVDTLVLRGQERPTSLYEVLWNEPEATQCLHEVHAPSDVVLRLGTGARTLELGVGGRATLGRASSCDVVLDVHAVSRHHASVFERRGRFFVRDTSTNGTYVLLQDESQPILLHRDELPLRRGGVLALGRPPGEGAGHTLSFEPGRRTAEAPPAPPPG